MINYFVTYWDGGAQPPLYKVYERFNPKLYMIHFLYHHRKYILYQPIHNTYNILHNIKQKDLTRTSIGDDDTLFDDVTMILVSHS